MASRTINIAVLLFTYFVLVSVPYGTSGQGTGPDPGTTGVEVTSGADQENTTLAPTLAATTAAATSGKDTSAPPVLATTAPPTIAPPTGPWDVANKSVVCILAEFNATVLFQYVGSDGVTANVSVVVPHELTRTMVSGSCDVPTGKAYQQFITIAMIDSPYEGNFALSMYFAKHGSDDFVISNISFAFHTLKTIFPTMNTTDMDKSDTAWKNESLYETSISHSFRCNTPTNLTLTPNKLNGSMTVILELADARIQAYRTTNDTEFSREEVCAADVSTSNIVPIVVGAALAVLVVGVLIAYLIGRRRHGDYQTV